MTASSSLIAQVGPSGRPGAVLSLEASPLWPAPVVTGIASLEICALTDTLVIDEGRRSTTPANTPTACSLGILGTMSEAELHWPPQPPARRQAGPGGAGRACGCARRSAWSLTRPADSFLDPDRGGAAGRAAGCSPCSSKPAPPLAVVATSPFPPPPLPGSLFGARPPIFAVPPNFLAGLPLFAPVPDFPPAFPPLPLRPPEGAVRHLLAGPCRVFRFHFRLGRGIAVIKSVAAQFFQLPFPGSASAPSTPVRRKLPRRGAGSHHLVSATPNCHGTFCRTCRLVPAAGVHRPCRHYEICRAYFLESSTPPRKWPNAFTLA